MQATRLEIWHVLADIQLGAGIKQAKISPRKSNSHPGILPEIRLYTSQ
jgi:hypothetical protein